MIEEVEAINSQDDVSMTERGMTEGGNLGAKLGLEGSNGGRWNERLVWETEPDLDHWERGLAEDAKAHEEEVAK